MRLPRTARNCFTALILCRLRWRRARRWAQGLPRGHARLGRRVRRSG